MKKILLPIISLIFLSFINSDIRSIYKIPYKANGSCVADIDLDGDLDIIINNSYSGIQNWGGLYILQNSNGTFSYFDSLFIVSSQQACQSHHVFSNLYPDIVSINISELNIVSFNGVQFSTNSYYLGERVRGFDCGDIDGDKDIDVVFYSNDNDYWGISKNIDSLEFSEPIIFNTEQIVNGVACGDLNNDSQDEIIVCGSETMVYYFNGQNFDTIDLNTRSQLVEISDLNNDNVNDIVAMSDIFMKTLVFLFENQGNNNIQFKDTIILDHGCSKMVVNDFNNDQLNDLLFSPHSTDTLLLLYNLGDFKFSKPYKLAIPFGGEIRRNIDASDMDNNGYLDIIVTRYSYSIDSASNVEILFNDSEGQFVDYPMVIKNEIENSKIKLKAFPNPLKTYSNIEFYIEESTKVKLLVYNLYGQAVCTLIDKSLLNGHHSIKLKPELYPELSNEKGIYIINLIIGNKHQQSLKLIIN